MILVQEQKDDWSHDCMYKNTALDEYGAVQEG